MKFIYLNMDDGSLHRTEDQLINSTEERRDLPQMEAITNLAMTETLIAAGHTPFLRTEAMVVYRNLKMGVPHVRTRH